jgi:hypothetical protein
MSGTDETVFIPCEICDAPVALDDYAAHADACNSARFISFHGISLSEILNPVLLQNHLPQQPERQSEIGGEDSGESEQDEDEPVPNPPPEIDFASNLASEDEEEQPEEMDVDELGQQISNLLFRALFNGRNIDRGVNIIPNPANAVIQGEPPSIDNLMARLQNLIAADANFEDVAVGLTPEQREYCLTTKRTNKATDTKDELGTCNICCEDNLDEMTTLICGHELCSPCATKHFTAHVKCPFCNQDLRDIMKV